MARKKIVITQGMDLYPDQRERLKKLGNVIFYDSLAGSHNEWLERCNGADVVCSGKFGLKQCYPR